MGELAEFYTATKKEKQERKARYRDYAPQALRQYYIPFKIFNDGGHIQIRDVGDMIDYWPGTGKFRDSGAKYVGRGLRNLIKYILKLRNA
jgi:hypothetical protein